MTNSIKRIFETPLGQVICSLSTDSSNVENIGVKEYENGKSVLFKVGGHRIELVEFKIRQPLHNGATVKDSNGWVWRIEKVEEAIDNIKISCALSNYSDDVVFDNANGEHLDAIEAIEKEWILNIGTEDGEVMNSRAEEDDGFPNRLRNEVNFYQSITKSFKHGFETTIPDLIIGEQIHLQFLVAYDKVTDEFQTNTWIAVDEFKRKLENWIGIW